MSLYNNDKNNQEFNEFLQSLQDDANKNEALASSGREEPFPFSDSFDIDSFVKENAIPSAQASGEAQSSQEPLASPQESGQEKREEPSPNYTELSQSEYKPDYGAQEPSYRYNEKTSNEDYSYQDEFDAPSYANSSFESGQSLKHLEQKISELESSFVDVNKEKAYYNGLQSEIEGIDLEDKNSFKPGDEFYKNMSATIETLKGSLKAISSANRTSVLNDISVLRGSIDNIVNARLQYEENLINQDQTLINRLREKTNRLKSINLALNSEVKRAKNEKLESLRKSAEQTKELLSLRVQLNKVEEKARHGDFKLSRMEQHLSILNQEKLALDEEIRKVREEKLSSIRKSSEQAKEIMSLRLALSKTEEKFKQEEIQNSFLREQLTGLESAKAALDQEVYSTRAEREAAKREASQQIIEIDKLKRSIQQSQDLLNASAKEAGGLREQILSLETKLQQMHGENAALSLRTEDNIRQLEAARAQHERDIAALKAEQMREIELLKNQKAQEAQSITLELRRAEDKYRQEETFVNTLKLQIESLRNDVKNLDDQKRGLEGKSADLAREIDFIKEGHEREIESLKQELASAGEKLTREQNQYQSLKETLSSLETEKASLNEEIRRILSAKDEALAANERYIKDIENLKAEHSSLESSLKSELERMTARHEQDLAEYNALKEKEAALRRDNAGYESRISELSAREEGYKKAGADYEARIKELQSKEESARKTNEEYGAKIAELESKKEQLLREKEAFERELKSKEENYSKELSNYKTKILALDAEQKAAVSNLTIEIENLKREHEGAVSSLNKESSTLREEKHSLLTEIDSLRLALGGRDEETRKLRGELDGLKAGIAAGNEEKLRLGKEIESLMRDITSRNDEKQTLLAQVEALKKDLTARDEAAGIAAREAASEIENLKRDISAREENAIKLNGEIEALRNNASQSEQQMSQLGAEIDKLKAELEENRRLSEEAKARYEEAERANAKRISELEESLSKNDEYVSQITEINSALAKAESAVKENENIINMLKGEVAAANSQKALIDEELKKAGNEKYEILKQLEEKTKALDEFQKRYEEEVTALKEARSKESADYEEKLKSAQERLNQETETVNSLKSQIVILEQEKANLNIKLSGSDLKASKIVEQTDEIISLKSKLAKAESRFLQDTVLVEQLKEQYTQSREMIAKLEDEILSLRKENAKVKEDLAGKEAEIKRLSEALAQSEAQVKEGQSAVKQLQVHTSQLKAVNAALDAEVKKAQGEKLEALRKSADQAKEILMLKQQLSEAESKFSTLDFENGIVSVRKEYEAKVEKLESELKDASALCARQVKELEELKTDNSRLKSAEEEKLKLQSSYDVLSEKAQSLENELAAYKQKEARASTLAKAKAAALSAQIAKINKEKAGLKEQLDNAMKEIERLTAKEKETAEALNTLKAKISDNDAVIEKLKKEIVILTAENRELKQNAEVTLRKEKALASKINEMEKENKSLVTSLNLAKEDAAKTELTLNKLKAERTQLKTRPSMPQPPAPQQPAAGKESVQLSAEAEDTAAPSIKTKTSVINPSVLPSTTERDMAYQDGSADAIAAFGEPVQELEVVEVEGNEMDLSMIFGDSDVNFKDENADSMPTATNPDIEQVKATTINQPGKALASMQNGGPYEEMEVTDHSIKAHGGISRKPASRLPPTYRGSEAYSDFLKKTKSVFYRIKWSLFKE